MYRICVVGLGYVGLPTACAFASKGFETVGVDIRSEIVDKLNKGASYIAEMELEHEVKRAVSEGLLKATTNLTSAVSSSEAVIIAVQTPVEKGIIQLEYLQRACSSVAESLVQGSIVVIESTVPPGTNSKLVKPIFEKNGLRDGESYYLAYCPERIAPGNSLYEFLNNDRIIGFDNDASGKKAIDIFKRVTYGKLHTTDIKTAETVKLVENTSRDVYIAFANELSKICSHIGVDTWEVIRLANTHPRVKILSPGPGVGGPCLTKDPYMLLQAWDYTEKDHDSLIICARNINENMYKEILKLFYAGIRKRSKRQKIAVLGTAYKADVGDPRNSPSEKVIRELLNQGYDVYAYDPYCKEMFGGIAANSIQEALTEADCCILMVKHSVFKKLRAKQLLSKMSKDAFVVDACGVFSKDEEDVEENKLFVLGGKSAHGIV